MASGVSGKRSAHSPVWRSSSLPRCPSSRVRCRFYLDVAEAMRTEGSCFTFPSPLLLALEEALRRKRDYAPLGNLVRNRCAAWVLSQWWKSPSQLPLSQLLRRPKRNFTSAASVWATESGRERLPGGARTGPDRDYGRCAGDPDRRPLRPASMKVRYRFKQAETPDEVEQIFRLNQRRLRRRIGTASHAAR